MITGNTPSGEHTGRVTLVTGGVGAIGLGIARRLAAEGAVVHVADVTLPPGILGPGITAHQADVAAEDDLRSVVAEIERSSGPVAYLVYAAAVFPARPFLEIPPAEWERTLAVNATGAFLACQAVLPGMISQAFGRIVLFSSMLARTGGTNCAAYATSKGAILGLARTLAVEVAQSGIRVNTLTPGLTDTPQPRGHLTEDQLAAKAAAIPLRRLGLVEDMVEGCLFLLSDDTGSYYTGQDLRVNGGSTIW